MPASTMTYTLNHHVEYFLEFRRGCLALVSRVSSPDQNEWDNLIRVAVTDAPGQSEQRNQPKFAIQVFYPQRNDGRNKFECFPMTEPTRILRKQIGHGVQGRAIVDIGPTVVILDITSDVGSYFDDPGFSPDTAECR